MKKQRSIPCIEVDAEGLNALRMNFFYTDDNEEEETNSSCVGWEGRSVLK